MRRAMPKRRTAQAAAPVSGIMAAMLKHLLWTMAGLLATLAAAAWWTTWLDPHLPALTEMRRTAQQTAIGQALSPQPEPHWVTVPGRPKTACLRDTQGELNETFMQCRSGHRELVRDHRDGTRTVLQREALREPEGLTPSKGP